MAGELVPAGYNELGGGGGKGRRIVRQVGLKVWLVWSWKNERCIGVWVEFQSHFW